MEIPARHREARALLQRSEAGILATHSKVLPGYPFGSVTPYCLDRQGCPVVLISDIAQHTRNIGADPRVALTVLARIDGDVQAGARLTLLADAAPIEEELEETAERYYRYFPRSRDYHRTHAFLFFRLRPVRARYIGGFGDIRWIEPQELLVPNPFSRRQENGIVAHMNGDHQDAMRSYLGLSGADRERSEAAPAFAGIDAEGFDLLHRERRHRFSFAAPVTTLEEARRALADLARRGGQPS